MLQKALMHLTQSGSVMHTLPTALISPGYTQENNYLEGCALCRQAMSCCEAVLYTGGSFVLAAAAVIYPRPRYPSVAEIQEFVF